MSDGESILLVLALLYLWECGHWVWRDRLALLPSFGGDWQPVPPAPALGDHRTGLVPVSLLPPWGTPILCDPWRVSLGQHGVYAWVPHSPQSDSPARQSESWLRWDDIRTVEFDDRAVLINGASFVETGSPAALRRLARRLSEWSKLPPASRSEAFARAEAEDLDVAKARSRVQEFLDCTGLLRSLCLGLFLLLFLGLPILAAQLDAGVILVLTVPLLIVLQAAIAILFFFSHRRLHPTRRADRWKGALVAAVYPPVAMRILDRLTVPLLEDFHPLAAVAALSGGEDLRMLARRWLRDARHPRLPVCPSADPLCVETAREHRVRIRETYQRFFAAQGLSLRELLAPPARKETANRSYCPRCEDQYVLEQGACWSCGGRRLAPLAAADEPNTVAPERTASAG